MLGYVLPETLDADIHELERKIADFKSGSISSKEFRSYRVPFGIYEQRVDDTYMLRIRCPAGIITPAQFREVSILAKQYGNGTLHITTRQEVQIHNVLIDSIIPLIKELKEIGLATRGGGGNTVRNIVVPSNAGIDRDEIFDVSHYAMSLTNHFIAEDDSWNLPRKYKIAFSGSSSDEAYATVTDLGFIARIKDGLKGFRVYIAGGMGAKSDTGRLLFDFVKDDEVLNIAIAVKRFFNKYGNRRNKHAARLRFLCQKLGEDEFKRMLLKEYEDVKNGRITFKLDNEIVNKDEAESIEREEARDEEDFNRWKRRFVSRQKQDGLYSILVPVPLGMIEAFEAENLSIFLSHFGANCMRFTKEQNILLRNVAEEYLGNVYNFLRGRCENFNRPKLIDTIISCTGADTCRLGICLSRKNLQYAIIPKLMKSGIGLDAIDRLKINISGCPNACGQHPIADIGFFGKAGRKGEYLYPAYNVLVGARVKDGETRFNRLIGDVSSHRLSDFLAEVLSGYAHFAKNNCQDFELYLENGGEEEIGRILDAYRDIPEFFADKNYYYDVGAAELFSVASRGAGECSAGLFDLIDLDKETIQKTKRDLSEAKTAEDKFDNLSKILYHASRMLLITRGGEPKNREEVYTLFMDYFIASGIVDKGFEDLLTLARKGEKEKIIENEHSVLKLSEVVINLYETMDDSFHFRKDVKQEREEEIKEKSGGVVRGNESMVVKDFRGVACPMNFVKTKIALEKMNTGEWLEIYLDDGEPIKNVPASIREEGHDVVEIKKIGNYWSVLMRKGG